MTTEPTTLHDTSFERRFDDHPIVVDDSAGQRATGARASDAARNRPRGRRFAAVVGAVAGLTIAAGASMVLIDQTTSAPDPAPVPGALSPSDVALGYLFSADVPTEIDLSGDTARPSQVQAQAPSPANEVLGYLFSADVPAEIDLSGGTTRPSQAQAPSPANEGLGYLLSADFPVLPADFGHPTQAPGDD